MSEIVLKSRAILKSSLPNWLHATFDWLRHARVAARLRLESVEDLSDHQLRDIGGERRDVTKAMDRELGRIGLLDKGWQQPKVRH
ncbi:hypothetical protein RFM68_12205 [Mesorhizobium sp. MSK_1335]|uniref:DUF1127 domain-containing protein n=1 Tax=Mesorhizobium montanum TaxID=3072323 RepID=A0ABU4ZIS5_9HYPH|nr:hypothetical protein [Mesorhizobium sp. MSK_1335]MDX8525273.1 hypothetical protein [Mesorhizobium sp. MSK_1335]